MSGLLCRHTDLYRFKVLEVLASLIPPNLVTDLEAVIRHIITATIGVALDLYSRP